MRHVYTNRDERRWGRNAAAAALLVIVWTTMTISLGYALAVIQIRGDM